MLIIVGGMNQINACCDECGTEGGASLKTCKPCMQVRYCNAEGQHKHWPKHKIPVGVAELRDAALFKDPPPKEDCPICFLPMPARLLSCVSLPNATRSSVPIYDYAIANKGLAKERMENYYTCCGKHICKGCLLSFFKSGNDDKCPFCNAERKRNATDEDYVAEIRKRVEANDAASIYLLANCYYRGLNGVQQDWTKAIELFTKSAELGNTKAHNNLAVVYHQRGDLKKAKFHFEAAAMAGHEVARSNLGILETKSRNMERAIKHWTIAASAGDYFAMHKLITCFKKRDVGRKSIGSTLKAYNKSCIELRSEARDAYIQFEIDRI